MNQISFLASEVSLEVVEVETLLILLENFFDLLLELGDPVPRWMFSVPDLLQRILHEFSTFFVEITSFALSLFE